MTKTREAELEQLVNDLAENLNLRRWKRADLIACIHWQQDLLCAEARKRGSLSLAILGVLTRDEFLTNVKG